MAECNRKCKAQKHQVDELTKRFSHYIEMQQINNNRKYGRENYYYKQVAEYDSKITFYSNYARFVEIYNQGLVKCFDI